MKNIEWIFSGIGVLILSILIGFIRKKTKMKNKSIINKSIKKDAKRTINQFGEKSQYIEKNDGDITIN